MFITKGDIGVGTILGSAVFNVLFVIGVCGVFAGTVSDTCVKDSLSTVILCELLFCFDQTSALSSNCNSNC